MKYTRKEMNSEILSISRNTALIISRYYLYLGLILCFFYVAINHYGVTPLNILFVLLLLHGLITAIGKINPKNEPAFFFQSAKRKYKYSKTNHAINQLSFNCCLPCFVLWQYFYYKAGFEKHLLTIFPSLLIASGIILYFVLIIIIKLRIHYQIKNNLFQ